MKATTPELKKIKKILGRREPALVPSITTLEPGRSAVIALRNPKVASLFFDRIWTYGKVPESIQLYYGSKVEKSLHNYFSQLVGINRVAELVRTASVDVDDTVFWKVLEKMYVELAKLSYWIYRWVVNLLTR